MITRAFGLRLVAPVQGRAVLGPMGLRSGSGGSGELDVLSAGLAKGYALALERLRSAAEAAGAHGVVGVRLEIRERDGEGARLTDFSATGTAVRGPGTVAVRPAFTATWTAGECATAARAGLAPVAVVVGVCAYYAFFGTTASGIDASWGNREHPVLTEAVRFARHAAQGRLRRAAEQFGADGVVAATLDLELSAGKVAGEFVGGPGDRICVCTAVGTAVRRTGARSPSSAPASVLPLSTPRGERQG